MFRSIGAVFLGYLTSFVIISALAVVLALLISGRLPDPDVPEGPLTTRLCLAYVVIGFLSATLSGYVTAWVARRAEVGHALVLTGIMSGLGALYFLSRLNAEARPEPVWYLVTNLLLPLVSVPLGGWLRARHVARRGLGGEA